MRILNGFMPAVACFTTLALSLPHAFSASGGTPDGKWLSSVKRQIEAEEYSITRQTTTTLPDSLPAWQAPNPAQSFRTYFTPDAVTVRPGLVGEGDWSLALQLADLGRPGSRSPVPAPSASTVRKNRIEYDRGSVTEWYVNTADGLEQGFTIHRPPKGARDKIVSLRLEVSGNLEPRRSPASDAIDFYHGAQPIQKYMGLKVHDSAGTTLAASMTVSKEANGPSFVTISYEDRLARYPVTVDPLVATWTEDGENPGDGFGYSVATAGDVNGDGYSDVIVGAYEFNNPDVTGEDEGKAYLYLGSSSGLATSPAWTAVGLVAGAKFGYVVASAGDVDGDGHSDVIIGAPFYDLNGSGTGDRHGRAFVYVGNSTGLASTPVWQSSGEERSGAYFGASVSTAGDVNGDGYPDFIVGAPYDIHGGYAFLYLGGQVCTIHPPACFPNLSTTAEWKAYGNVNTYSPSFGHSVAGGDVNGDGYSDVIIGADNYTGGGGAFIWFGGASGMGATGTLYYSANYDWYAVRGNNSGARFGFSVATAGDVNHDGYSDVLVGAFGDDNGQTDEGRAYLYLGSSSLPTPPTAATASWTAESDQAGAGFGFSVATAGDVNNDNYSDVLVGAYLFDNGQTNEGRAYLYLGGSSGLASSPDWTGESDNAGARFGFSVATAGDVDGDGYDDVVIGADRYSISGGSEEGRAYLFQWSP